MAEQHLVSLQEMQARFEQLKRDELEITCEVTLPVTISVYRGEKRDGTIPPLYCSVQFEGKGDMSYSTKLLDQTGVEAHILEDVSEAFNIPMDAKLWEVSIEEE
jgi:hypothetical protein